MSAKRIYMDHDMLEGYANYNEAADSFLSSIALENINLDTTLQLEFDIAEDDLFSNYACEAIGETVKNMASKAKSNFVTYAKKLVNFLFGWLINFFRGSANVKQTMAKSYSKARDYLKNLNKLETKARGSDKESKIEITDFGNCVLVGLFMMQAIIVSTQRLGETMTKSYQATNGQSDQGDGKRLVTMRAFGLMEVMLDELGTLFATVGAIDISNPENLISKLRTNNFNVKEVMNSYAGDAQKLKDEAGKSSANESFGFNFDGYMDVSMEAKKNKGGFVDRVKNSKFGQAVSNTFKGKQNNAADTSKNGTNDNKNNSENDIENQQSNDALNKKAKQTSNLESSYKSRLEDTAKYMSDPDKAEMNYAEAFDELRNGLNLFINISKNNKWDLERNIKAAEKIRRGLEKELNAMSINEVNDKVVSDLLTRILKVGNHLGQVQRSAGIVVKRISACIDGMTTDVAKLGSKLVKLGDTE